MNRAETPELDLRALLRILRRRLWVVLLVPTLVTLAAVASASAKTSRYRSSAEILVARTQAEAIFNPLQNPSFGFVDPNRLLANQIRVVGSREVTDLARKRLGFAADVSAKAATTEDVITLSAVDVDARRSAAIVNAYAQSYLEYRRSTEAGQNRTAQAELQRQITAGEARLAQLDKDLAGQPPARRDQVKATQDEERQSLQTQVVEQRARRSQLEAAANVEQGGAQLLAPAAVPSRPFEPSVARSGLLGLTVGLMLGLGLAVLLDYLDNRIRGHDDLEQVSGNLPVVGLVPMLPGWRNHKAAHVASLEEPTSGAAEAYRALRTSIQFLGLDRSLRTLQITSALSGEGKTTTLVNLAVALARAGQRVVVVDCDLRRPRVHEFFGLDPSIGFTSVLVGDVALSEALQRVPDVDGLLVLASGPVPPNPSEVLSGRRTIEILTTLQADADVVLIDSPPVLPVSDATALSTRVDGTLIVVNANSTHRKQLTRTIELLRQVEAVVVGTVLNRVGSRHGSDDAYGYGYRPYVRAAPANGRGRPGRGRSKGPDTTATTDADATDADAAGAHRAGKARKSSP